MADGRIILITHDHAPARALANSLAEQGLDLTGIVLETKPAGGATRCSSGLVRRLLPASFCSRVSRLKMCLTETRTSKRLARIEAQLSRRATGVLDHYLRQRVAQKWPRGVDRLTVPTCNSDESYRFLVDREPELVVVYQASILKPRILNVPRLGALNAHPSLLPDYRGSLVEFWQVYNDDHDKAGITVHFIDAGVDTGDIVFQRRLDATSRPDHFLLAAMNTMSILDNYPCVIGAVLRGETHREKQGSTSLPTYKVADLTMTKKRELFARYEAKAH